MKRPAAIFFALATIFSFFPDMAQAGHKITGRVYKAKTATLTVATQDHKGKKIPNVPFSVDEEKKQTGKDGQASVEVAADKKITIRFDAVKGYRIQKPKNGISLIKIKAGEKKTVQAVYRKTGKMLASSVDAGENTLFPGGPGSGAMFSDGLPSMNIGQFLAKWGYACFLCGMWVLSLRFFRGKRNALALALVLFVTISGIEAVKFFAPWNGTAFARPHLNSRKSSLDVSGADSIVAMTPGGREVKTFDVSGGSFSIDTSEISSISGVVLVVADSKTDTAAGVIGIPDSAEHISGGRLTTTLDHISGGQITSDMDLGTLSHVSGVAVADTTIKNSGAFKDADLVESIAEGDNSTRLAVNGYSNPAYSCSPSLRFYMGTPSDINGAFGNPDSAQFSGYNIRLEAPQSEGFVGGTPVEGFDSSDQTILHPPVNVSNTAGTAFTPEGGIQWSYRKEWSSGKAFYEFLTGTANLLQGEIPYGDWTLKLGGASKAVFNLAGAYPLNQQGKAVVPMPAFRLNTANGAISSIDVQWKVFRNGTWEDASEDLMKSLVGNFGGQNYMVLTCPACGARRDETYGSYTGKWNFTAQLSNPWQIGDGNGDYYARIIEVTYKIGNAVHEFIWDYLR